MKKVIIAMSALFLAQPALSEECREDIGAREVALGNYDAAYSILKHCEDDETASANTLVNLANLYESPKLVGLTQKEATKRMWLLTHRAAAQGHRGALESLVRLYAEGEAAIRVRANEDRSACLQNLVQSEEPTESDVIVCLTL